MSVSFILGMLDERWVIIKLCSTLNSHDSITNNSFTQVTPFHSRMPIPSLQLCFFPLAKQALTCQFDLDANPPHPSLQCTMPFEVGNPMVIQSEVLPISAVSNIPPPQNDRRSSLCLLSQPSIWQVSNKAPKKKTASHAASFCAEISQ